MKKTFLSFTEKLQPKSTKATVKVYSVLYAILAFFSFAPFFYMFKTLLRNEDGFLQHFSTIKKLHNLILQVIDGKGFAFWSWDLGLGSDTIGALATVIFDPFCYLNAAFPPAYQDIGYTLVILLQTYVAGLAFIGFASTVKMPHQHALWGAIGYAFSAWVVTAVTHHNCFVTVAICFALLMMGVEKVLRKESPVILILAAFASAVTYLYFAYMSAIIVLIYLLIRYFSVEEKKGVLSFLAYMGKFVGYVLVATCLSLIVIVPVIYILQCSPKSTAITIPIFFELKTYLQSVSILTTGKELFGHYSCIAVSPLFLIMLPAMAKRFRSHTATPAMKMLLISFIFLLFPITNSIMNGGSYPVGRWCYTATFFFIWSGIECLHDEYLQTCGFVKHTKIFLLFLGTWNFLLCRLLFGLLDEVSLLVTAANLAFGYFLLKSISGEGKIFPTIPKRATITLLMAANIILVYTFQFIPTISDETNSYVGVHEEYNKIMFSTQKAATEIEDDSFYRVDQIDFISMMGVPEGYANTSFRPAHTPTNESMYWGTKSIYTYLSTTPNTLFSLYKALGNNQGYFRRVCTYNNDNRSRLDFLMGVKYFLGNNPSNNPPEGADGYAPSCFQLNQTSSGGVNIYKSNYSIGLGCTYDSYITESELNELSYPDREQALMECAVLPDDTKTELKHRSVSGISAKSNTLDYDIIESFNIFNNDLSQDLLEDDSPLRDEQSFTVTQANGGISLDITEDKKECEVYVYFKNLRREPKDKIETCEEESTTGYAPANLINYMNHKDYGDFYVQAEREGITKKAMNTIGSEQGFSDIEDFYLNLGDYPSSLGNIKITFSTPGTYTFDDFKVISVPKSTYIKHAEKLEKKRFREKKITDDLIKGTVRVKKPSVLYLSIPYNLGWKVYVDGKECDSVTPVHYNFTGIPIDKAGTHTIELRFKPVGFDLGVKAFAVGAILTLLLGIIFRKKRKTNE